MLACLAFLVARDDATTAGPRPTGPGVATPPGVAPQPADLARGNVVLQVLRGTARPAARALARELGDGGDPALRAAGQAVIVIGASGGPPAAAPAGTGAPALVAYAHDRHLAVADPADPRLRAFTEYWLGRGAPG